ncbi:MAG: prolyl aminopeptidase [Alphaproteobacteria bacterium]|jgi:proline iminopeptidase|nr:prolyl aminopeptidase [Alphaproteobacteria bacterium]MBO6861610.1 prolyl aminopeptidase [Alphaproteobacteria bacterium]MEC9268779.1 prolyl aminopeptidase [Pseudomonadota bacterium]
MSRDRLYPAIEPNRRGHLEVEAPHSIYWEESGNPNGIPVCFLHGGPGAGTTPGHRRFFDPEAYRIVLHDQRGAGRSRPAAEIRNNDTGRLIADIEALREMLDIDRWIVFGGSWGSSLALAYAQAHPHRVLSMVLRGIFLCRKKEIDWFLHGMGTFFPEEHARFLGHLEPEERADPLAAYNARLNDPDEAVHGRAAEVWSRYEAVCSTLRPNADSIRSVGFRDAALPLARLEAHYFAHNLFVGENQLLDDAGRLTGIPGVIVQGRYDVVCPPTSAYDLVQAWPEARLRIVDDAGHSATEPGIMRALVDTMDALKSSF